ncbi:MAG: sigma 54-interacting transcriptional regulator [Duodenibacillus massiliensis]
MHENSPRATGPFVKINLAGMTVRAAHDLFAGEVSGGIAGCATGLFAQAAGGTLFLERVDEADGAVLSWLCEVLHREEYEGVKGFTVTDFRWMMSAGISSRAFAAFGEAQKTLVAEAVPVFIEPLSARRDDVELLVRHFLSDFRRQGEGTADVSPEALSALTGARWKANIRELRETVFAAARRAAAEDASCITPEMLSLTQEPADEADSLFQPDAGIRPVAEVNDLYIRWAVNRFSGSRAQLARRLGISERTLYRLAAAQRLARKKSAVGK